MKAVETRGLTHVYPPASRSGSARTALSGLDLSVDPGEIFGLVGPNGGGKTTLFKILCTSLLPTGGGASIFGLDVVERPAEVRRKIGIVFQNPALDKKLTLLENLLHQGRLYGLAGNELRRRAGEMLERLRLGDRAGDFVESLSGGLQRRGEILKGLLHKPELLLMDEPSTGLDPGARRDMWDYLFQLKKEGMTILLTTHLMEEAEKCDRLAILNQGACVASGAPLRLKEEIGGDVISIQSPRPGELCEKIAQKFGGSPAVVDNVVRIEKDKGHAFIPQLVEAFPGLVETVTLGKPTLEDVFIHKTGRLYADLPSGDGR